jgi:hypothetical protein
MTNDDLNRPEEGRQAARSADLPGDEEGDVPS